MKAKIKNMWAERKTQDIVMITWELIPYMYNAPYKIYRSITGSGGYELIGSGQGNAFLDDISKIRDNEYIEYRIESGEEIATAQMNAQADNWLLAVAGDYLWQLKYASASTKAVAYCLGKSNDNCPECFSETLNKRVKTECATCDGSGKMTSYVGPIPLRFSPMRVQKGTMNMGTAERADEVMTAWTGNTPLLNAGDIIITCDHIKYVVQDFPLMTSMHSTIRDKMFISKQVMVLKRMQDSEYPKLLYAGKEDS